MTTATPAYVPNSQHRNASMRHIKSQWTISLPDEVACFNLAYQQGWSSNGDFWGVHSAGAGPQIIGYTPSSPWAYIAKFVGPIWHGYPVAHWTAPYERPAISVLNSWEAAGYIKRTTKSKIRRGKKCVL